MLRSPTADVLQPKTHASQGDPLNNNNNNRRLVTLAEHTSDHGRQTNPLSMDLFGTMIEVISEMINTMAPNVGVQIGDDKVSNCLFC